MGGRALLKGCVCVCVWRERIEGFMWGNTPGKDFGMGAALPIKGREKEGINK